MGLGVIGENFFLSVQFTAASRDETWNLLCKKEAMYQQLPGHVFCGQMSSSFYIPKMTKTIQAVISERCKSQRLWWCGGASVATAWIICICVKVPHQWHLQSWNFWRDTSCHQGWEVCGYFSQTMPDLVLNDFQQCCLIKHRVYVLEWPVCSPHIVSY